MQTSSSGMQGQQCFRFGYTVLQKHTFVTVFYRNTPWLHWFTEIHLGYTILQKYTLVTLNSQSINQSINQSVFYFMSVHIEVILDTYTQKTIYSNNLPAGLCTINLTIEIIISVLYKMPLTLLQSLKS